MRWRPRVRDRDWHLWFAWYPIQICGVWVWLEWVKRAIIAGSEIDYALYRLPDGN